MEPNDRREPNDREPNTSEPNTTEANGQVSRRSVLSMMGVGMATRKLPRARRKPVVAPSVSTVGATTTSAAASPSTTAAASSMVPTTPGILVTVALYGGNDGLNTVIPLDAGPYLQGRGALAYQASEAIALGDGLGLHPALTGLKGLWDSKQLAIVRGVGYPEPSRSHFRSNDIWNSAQPKGYADTGWLGRWYDTVGTDPLGMVAIASSVPRSMVGAKTSAVVVPLGNVTSSVPADLAKATVVMSQSDDTLGPVAAMVRTNSLNLGRVNEVFGPLLAGQAATSITTSLEPGAAPRTANELDLQLNVVARLIKAGAPTRAYSVGLGGFDTHANEKANHARLMGILDKALSGFANLMAQDPLGRTVTVLVTSEFGRRVAANGSGGTDHGTAAPVFVLGPSVKGGFYGDQPPLTNLDQGDLRFTIDFRAVYTTLLGAVLGADPKVSVDGTFPPLGFL